MDARPGIAGIEYPVRPMLAVTAPRRPTSHPGRWAAEPKLDGFRCITRRSEHRVALQSRQQRSLTRYFPEIVAAVAELDVEVVLDGEVVLWREGRIDFAALQRRLHPVEGVVAKRLDHTYRPTNGRTWSKIRTRLTAEAIVGGVIGSLEQPEALILGRHDHRGRLRVAGRTTPLLPAARTEIAAVLTPAAGGHPWPPAIPSSRFGQLPSEPIEYLQVAPTAVVELDVDTAFENYRWRHGARFVRVRPDLRPRDVPSDAGVAT